MKHFTENARVFVCVCSNNRMSSSFLLRSFGVLSFEIKHIDCLIHFNNLFPILFFFIFLIMKFDRKLLNTIQSLLPVQIFISFIFAVSGIIVHFAQLLTWIFIWPFSKQLYRRINYFLGTLLWSRKCIKKTEFAIK